MDQTNITVVIVEDHLVTLDGLAAALSQQPNLKVLGKAPDYQSGVSLVQEMSPDCLLLDLHLPDSPGPTSMIRKFAAITNAHLIVFSGEDREILIESALDAGAQAYILKSKPASYVCRVIEQVVIEGRGEEQYSNRKGVRLSGAEKSILHMLARGMRYQEMAEHRASTISTVRKQCERLAVKLDLSSREELIVWAVRAGYGIADQ